ncbi:MAG: radical SAM protein, partial [Candidatus Thorarchaeota archaeon]
DHRFRIGMFNPNLVMDKLEPFLDVMSSPRFFEFYHVPLQSGSDAILRKMNRRYSVQEWKDVVHAITSRFPRATIATDIIVGFPGETDADFQMTLEALQDTRPSVINISKYGDRPGTLASKSTEKVLTQVKKDRSRQLSRYVDSLVRESNKSWIGWNGEVIITSRAKTGQVHGRTFSYKPVIINGLCDIGRTINVIITDAKRTHLVGEIT